MENIIPLIAELGFPIAITTYLLLRIENKLTHLTEAIYELKETMLHLNHVQESRA